MCALGAWGMRSGGGGGWRRACHEMEVAVWFSQSLYMMLLAVIVQMVKKI